MLLGVFAINERAQVVIEVRDGRHYTLFDLSQH